MYKVVTPVATEPVTTAEAKLHCKVDHSDDDTLIATLITAAREFAEHHTGRAFAAQTLEMALNEFPDDSDEDWIDLDLPPVATVSSVKYTDTAGVEQTISSSDYTLSAYGESRRINPAYSVTWPLTQDIPDAVRIRYVTGYTALPKAAKQGLLLVIGHFYEMRGPSTEDIPAGALALLNTIKGWAK